MAEPTARSKITPFSNAHSEDESVDLKDLERSTLAEALFFEYLAAT